MRLIIRDVIPIIILLIIWLSILRVTYNIKGKKKYCFRDFIYLMYIIYIVILLYTVTYDGLLAYEPTINLILFKEIFRYKIGSYLFLKNALGNILMFLPYGSFLTYQFDLKKRYVILLTFIFSVSIELVQLLIGRVFDIDDILLNIIGSIIGYGLINKKKE